MAPLSETANPKLDESNSHFGIASQCNCSMQTSPCSRPFSLQTPIPLSFLFRMASPFTEEAASIEIRRCRRRHWKSQHDNNIIMCDVLILDLSLSLPRTLVPVSEMPLCLH
jgi:hypothetical protein